MSQLLVKLLLAPAFVVAASLVVRRYGPLVGGVVGGLPVVAGPILLAFALDHGAAFGARAAVATLLGLVSLTAFVVAYAALAPRLPVPLVLPAGWAAFLLATAAFAPWEIAAGAALALAWGVFALALRVLLRPGAAAAAAEAARPPRWDLPARAGSALALVLALTAVAGSLGPHVSGLLAPFPIIASILAAFTHAQAGVAAAQRLLRGLVLGFFGFALFCFVVAVALRPLGIALAFGLATVAALVLQGAVLALRVALERPGPAAPLQAGETP